MKNIFTTFLFLFACSVSVFSQSGPLEKGDELFRLGAYYAAIPQYQAYLKTSQDIAAVEKLAECYRKTGNSVKAEKWYAEALKFGTDKASAELVFHYAGVLRKNGKNEIAANMYREFGEKSGDYNRGNLLAQACESPEMFRRDSIMGRVVEMNYKFGESDIAPSPMGNSLIIASARRFRRFVNPTDLGTGQPMYDLYVTEKPVGIALGELKILEGSINSLYHDGPACATKDGQTIYFTRNNSLHSKLQTDEEGLSRLKIFESQLVEGQWKEIGEVNFNGTNFSTAHPSLSADGSIMYFSSDRPDGFGGMDIWKAEKEGSAWGVPENLGSEINTEGDELFPSCPMANMLVFASDGHPGMGGLDLLVSEFRSGAWTVPYNFGHPINGNQDDFGMYWDINRSNGYLTSNRNKHGNDRIYYFERRLGVKGMVRDSVSGKPVAGVTVEILDGTGRVERYESDANGMFSPLCKPAKEYFLTFKKADYETVKLKYKMKETSLFSEDSILVFIQGQLKHHILGLVRDKSTLQTIYPTTVEFYRDDDVNHSVNGAIDGKFRYKAEKGHFYNVIVSAAGYVPATFRVHPEEIEGPNGFEINAFLEKGDYVLVEGIVVTFDNGIPMPNVEMKLMDNSLGTIVHVLTSGPDGKFWIPVKLSKARDYSLVASRNGYFTSRLDIETDMKTGAKKAVVKMKLAKFGEDVVVKTIYYDYNASNLTELSKIDLNEIYYFLSLNPEAKLELGAHTDCRGPDDYNMQLSQKRAEAAVNYFLAKRDVGTERIFAKGYGKNRPVTSCGCMDKNNVCSEEEHARNRRAELRVTSILRTNP